MLLDWVAVFVIAVFILVISIIGFFFLSKFDVPLQIKILCIGFGILASDFLIFLHFYSLNAYSGFELIFMAMIDTAKLISFSIPYKYIVETFIFHGETAIEVLFCILAILTPLLWCDCLLILFSFFKNLKTKDNKEYLL